MSEVHIDGSGSSGGWPILTSHRQAFDAALAEFAAGAFFDAHESLEELWMLAAGAEKRCLQGLIQLSVACYHWQQGNARGAASLLAKAEAKLCQVPDGLNLKLLAEIQAARHLLQTAQQAGEAIPLPVIRLLADQAIDSL